MYLRYGDPSWDAADAAADVPPTRHSSAGGNGHANGNGRPPAKRKPDLTSRFSDARPFPSVRLAGVRIDAITEARCIQYILDELDEGRGGMLVTPNLDHLQRCTKNLAFTALVAEADLVVADGMPLVWASRLQGTPLPERVAGSNLINSLSGAAAKRGRSVFLLGGAEGTAAGAARVLAERFPGLRVAGTYYPPFGFENDPRQMADIVASLSAARPDIVYVALGSPKQEKLIARLRQILPDAWWLGVGNSFSFLCGHVRRAPRWMQVSGLEWIHRLFQEPKRLFRRYVVVGIPFASSLLTRSALQGIPNRLFTRDVRERYEAMAPQPAPTETSGGANGDAHPADDLSASITVPPIEASAATLRLAEYGFDTDPQVAPYETEQRQPALSGPAALSRLRALVLLGGAVRPSPLAQMSGRSVLDMPLDESGTILTHWINSAAELAKSVGLEKLPVRVMVNQNSPEPTSGGTHYGAFRVERDASEFRGTGGVLHDLAKEYGDDDLILMANAAQILLDPLPTIVTAMTRKAGDVAVISHEDGTPSGLMLITVKTLRGIADAGYVDMKEQALPQIAANHEVRVVRRRRPTGLPIRTLDDYVQALRLHHRRRQGKPFIADPMAEDWSPSFALIEPGATVDPTARIHDSIVLAGGTVEAGAVLVRSIVCAGEVVRRDKTIVDQFVCAEEVRGRRGFEVLPRAQAAAAAVVA